MNESDSSPLEGDGAQALRHPHDQGGGVTESRLQRAHGLHVCTVALLAVALYLNTLPNELINDDVNVIVNNPAVRSLDPGLIFGTASWWPPTAEYRLYRPLPTLSYALNYRVGGLDPRGYHVGNLLLHALTSVMLYALVLRLSRRALAAWAAAALFAAHPINSEAVAAVVGRAELMAALSVIVALWTDAASYTSNRLSTARGAAVVAAFFCGLLCKDSAVALLPALLATDLALRCRWQWGDFVSGLRGSRGRLYAALALTFCAYLLLRWEMGVHWLLYAAMNPLLREPVSIRLLNALVIAGRYLWLLILPLHLSADYMVGAVPIIRTVWDWRVAASALGLTVCATAAVLAVRRAPMVTWGVLFAVASYALVSNVLFALPAMMGERWLYMPAAGFCTVVAFGAAFLTLPAASSRWLGPLAVIIVLIGYGARTVVRNRDWHDYVSLWTATLEVVPGSYKAREGLAWGFYRQGRFDESIRLLEEARLIHDTDPRTYTLLGASYLQLGKLDPAIQVYQDLLVRMPNALDVRYELGRLYLRQQRFAEAAHEFGEAAALAPSNPGVHLGLAKAYYFSRRFAEAEASYRETLKLSPEMTEALVGRGACEQERGDFSAAARDYLQALALGEPPTDELRASLDRALTSLARAGKESADEAREITERASQYFPRRTTAAE